MNAVAVPAALASATCFALAATLQHRAAGQETMHHTLDPRLLWRLVRRPLWLTGQVASVAGVAFQALALAFGALAVVQPVLVSGLLVSVPLQAFLDRRRPSRRDLTAVALASAGLAAFLTTARPQGGIAQPSGPAWAWTGIAVGPIVAGCLLLGRRSTGTRRATWLGIATGVLYGTSAALLKTCAAILGQDPLALLADWHLYALVGVGATGLLLNQNAFQGASLPAPLTALTLTDPLVALLIGVNAFHEHLSANGPRAGVLALAALAMARGTWLASRGHHGAAPAAAAPP